MRYRHTYLCETCPEHCVSILDAHCPPPETCVYHDAWDPALARIADWHRIDIKDLELKIGRDPHD